ncbi:MAG: CHAT domain-containing protein [Gemmatimonas sp.]
MALRAFGAALVAALVVGSAPLPSAAADATLADIAAMLDREKLDPTRLQKVEKSLKAEPPAEASPAQRLDFHIDKSTAYYSVGRYAEAVAEMESAVEAARNAGVRLDRALSTLSVSYRSNGQLTKALAVEKSREPGLKGSRNPSGLLASYRQTVILSLMLFDIDDAEATLKKMEAARNGVGVMPNSQLFTSSWAAPIEDARGRIYEARGRYAEAERAFQKAAELFADARMQSRRWPNPPREEGYIASADYALAAAGMNKARQGRLKDAEIDGRHALLNELQAFGKYGGNTTKQIEVLAQILMLQGRYQDAERLFRAEVGILRDLGFAEFNPVLVRPTVLTAKTLALEERWQEASTVYDAVAAAIAGKPGYTEERVNSVLATPDRVLVLYRTGRIDEGIRLATEILGRTKTRMGDEHYDTAVAKGQLAMGLTLAKRGQGALPLFRESVPVLTASQPLDDGSGSAAMGALQVRQIVETYIALLANLGGAPPKGVDPALESLKLVDFIRGQSVQRALAASSARAATRDPELATLVRQDQDDEREINGLLQSINDALSLPPDQRDAGAIKEMQATVAKLRKKHESAWSAIERKFPDYANLINPKAPSVEDIRKALKPGEAFVSFYLGRQYSFVWVVPHQGTVGFASTALGAADIERKVNTLREALEPKAETLDSVPPYDLATAYELYEALLKPVEAAWKPAKSLVLVTNGAMGLLPLGLLPTAPATVAADPSQPMFAGYRSVPWLARTHAVTLVPSAAAFTTLRKLPPSRHTRETMIGFGDPLFSREQATEAARSAPAQVAQATATRGVPLQRRNAPKTAGVDGAELALLPRLPDTSEELRSIALALQADPSKVLLLGKEANTRNVKTADLTKYKIVAFATHGLVPGELEGLTQPALALSAPDVADVDGDGLLTMDEILGLKLDADWVVLSACNTGAGSGAGAEAASGLGRAFFYAGTRALLVTNWSVHSVSARELVTDLFRRQSADAKLSRAEALREASMALLDGPGFVDGGKTVFTYAHPIFWAPYSIIGDGSGA